MKLGARVSLARTRARSLLHSIRPFVVSVPREEQPVPTHDHATLPSILVVSMPKSGTVFTRLTLSRGLSLEQSFLSCGRFPHLLIDIPKLASFIRGGKVCGEHFDPSPVNLDSLAHFTKRWVLHIRDPRSVVLSWVHHMNRLYSEQQNGEHQCLGVYPAPPLSYYDWPFRRQVDWNIENFLPSVVAWVRSWLRVHDSHQYDILLTTYSELACDELRYIHKILDFYGVPRGLFQMPKIQKTIQGSHFRTGLEDEWMTAFTHDQILRVTEMIGEDLLMRFAWVPLRTANLHQSALEAPRAFCSPKP